MGEAGRLAGAGRYSLLAWRLRIFARDLHASCHHAAKQHRLRDQTTLETSEKPAFMDAHY